ncbi:MAG: NAD(+) salvage pathway protein [Bogoriella megaspora]|nr:MAG: NAD(+) salvage pathway protein [Bogoriella megaspora]
MAPPPSPFHPALLVIDLQNDFCPPSGSLAVPSGRTITPLINLLLTHPFILKIATRDFHPPNHISFASQHPPPNNQPFISTTTIVNPSNPDETQESTLWPDHCVQGTHGAELIDELEKERLDAVVLKGRDERVEAYSGFGPPFRRPRVRELEGDERGLAERLRERRITDVFVTGLATDYCVKWTAMDAVEEGFRTYIVREGVKGVDEEGAERALKEMEGKGVRVVGNGGEEVGWVKSLDET